MTTEYTDKFFEQVYKWELEHKDRLDSLDHTLGGMLIILSGVGIYYLKILPSCSLCVGGCLFVLFASLFGISFIYASVQVILSFWPRYKAYISSPQECEDYITTVENYHAYYQKDPEAATERIDEEVRTTLRRQYVEASAINRQHNLNKTAFQSNARCAIAIAVAVVLANAWPTYVVQRNCSQTQKVEVVAIPEVRAVQVPHPAPEIKTLPKSQTPITENKPDGKQQTTIKPAAPTTTATATANTEATAQTTATKNRSAPREPNSGGKTQQELKESKIMADKKPVQPPKQEAPKTPPPKPIPPNITRVKGSKDVGDNIKGDKK